MVIRRWWRRIPGLSTQEPETFEPLTRIPDGDTVLGEHPQDRRWRDILNQPTVAPDESRRR